MPEVKLDANRDITALCCCKLGGVSMPECKVIEACEAIDTCDRKVHYVLHSVFLSASSRSFSLSNVFFRIRFRSAYIRYLNLGLKFVHHFYVVMISSAYNK